MNIKIGILNVPKHYNKHDLIHFVTTDEQDATCMWEIEASEGDRVQLYFPKLNIPSDDDCTQDYLEVLLFCVIISYSV